MARTANKKLIELTRSVEPDNQETTGGVRQRVYMSEATWEGKGGGVSRGENRSGAAVTTSTAPTAREGATLKVTADLVHGLNTDLLADFLRIAGPDPEVSVTSPTIAADPAATHSDGSVGPALLADPGILTPFRGAEDLLIKSLGWSDEDNAWPRAIKHVHEDGTQIDLDPLYVQGEPGAFGAPLIPAAAGPEITISIGRVLSTGTVDRWVSFEGIQPDIGLYQMFVGALCSKYEFKADGAGKCQEMYEYLCRDYLAPTAASLGAGIVELPEARHDHISGRQVHAVVLGGSTVISRKSVTSAKWMLERSDAKGAGGVLGADSLVSVNAGDTEGTAEVEAYHRFDTTLFMSQISREGRSVPMDCHCRDVDGNETFYRLPRLTFDPRAMPADGKGTWKGTLSAGRYGDRQRLFSAQLFDAK